LKCACVNLKKREKRGGTDTDRKEEGGLAKNHEKKTTARGDRARLN